MKRRRNIIRSWSCYTLEREEYKKCFERMFPGNLQSVVQTNMFISMMALGFTFFPVLIENNLPKAIVYIIVAAIAAITAIYARRKYNRYNQGKHVGDSLIYALIILSYINTMAFGIYLGVWANPDNLAVTIMVFFVCAMFLFFVPPFFSLTLTVGAMAVFIISTVSVKNANHSTFDIVNALIAGIVSIVFTWYISRYKIQAELNASKLDYAREIAEQSSQYKSRFLATVSHEIRTPLNAIIGIAQIQLQEKMTPEKHEEASQKIFNSGNSLLGIVNDILDMSKIETGKLELNPAEYDVPGLINDTVQLNIVRIGSKSIKFELDISENLPFYLFGDELRIKQILNNLLSNAIKYTEKGFVKLSVDHTDEEGSVLLRLIVEDSGQGMKPKDCEDLFSEYSRFNIEANRTNEGTGLGLSITKRLVEMMDGAIDVKSEYGKGSIFTVTIRQRAVECPEIGHDLSERLRSFTFTDEQKLGELQITREIMPYGSVLIVDDAETNLYVAKGLLGPYQLKIDTADSGFAAIEKIKNNSTYDIIFMDHMMPRMDGIETTQKIRESGYRGVIVVLTANALVGNDRMFAENGFDGFISKPIDARQLDTMLNRHIRDRYPEESLRYKQETIRVDIPGVDDKLLQIFSGDAERSIYTLREAAANSDIKLYTTTVHAMKSALANVGEMETSRLAAALEIAGQKGDKNYISANTEGFIKALEIVVNKFKPLIQEAQDTDNDEDTPYLTEQLRIIESACTGYDEKTAYEAFDRLKEKSWRQETQKALEGIRDMLFYSSDFDGAAEKAKALLAQVTKLA